MSAVRAAHNGLHLQPPARRARGSARSTWAPLLFNSMRAAAAPTRRARGARVQAVRQIGLAGAGVARSRAPPGLRELEARCCAWAPAGGAHPQHGHVVVQRGHVRAEGRRPVRLAAQLLVGLGQGVPADEVGWG